MKSISISVLLFSILVSSLIVFAPGGTAADGRLNSVAMTQRADACCQGKRGNVDMSGIADLGGLSALVSYLTGSGCVLPSVNAANVNGAGVVELEDLSALVSYPTGGGYVLPCTPEANVNNTGIVDLADLCALVSYLTSGGYVLPNCP